MIVSVSNRRRIAGRARTFHERLESGIDHERPSDGVDELLEQWRENVAAGDDERFDERLAQLGLTREKCRSRLGSNDWPPDEPLPEWIDRIDDLLEYFSRLDVDDVEVPPEEAESVPFVEFVEAIVEYASEEVDWETGARHLEDDGANDLKELLSRRVRLLCTQTLFLEFKNTVATHNRELAFADDPPMPDRPRQYYDEFIERLFDDGLEALFVEYSFLARLLATTIDNWIEFVEEFLSRLRTDSAELSQTFTDGSNVGRVTDVTVCGDRHASGRATLGVTFTSGVRLAYKPRDVEIAVAFWEFASWVDERSESPDLRAPEYLSGDGYGWMEWIEHESCSSRRAVERYHKRVGALVCLLYSLRFTDGHMENLVSGGEYPVPIDLETLATPGRLEEFDSANPGTYRLDTVLQSGLLPEAVVDTGGDAENVPPTGGLAFAEATWSGLQIPEYVNVNTDVMDLSYRTEKTTVGQNLPKLDDEIVRPNEHVTELVEGFETTYRVLWDHRDELLSENGPLSMLRDQEIRVLYRPTRWYGILLRSTQQPAYLRTGREFGCRAALLARTLVNDDEMDVTQRVYRAEREALVRLDIPRFTTTIDSRDVWLRGERVDEDVFPASALERIHDRIRRFGEADLARQLDYFDLSFEGKLQPRGSTTTDTVPATTDGSTVAPRREAKRLFEQLTENATEWEGAQTWVQQRSVEDGFTVRLIEDNLYEGRIGVALFGAALYRTCGEQRYRDFVDDVLEPLLETIHEGEYPENRPIGVAGDGGIVYGLTKIGSLLTDETYVEAATRVASKLTVDRLREHDEFEVMMGSAGAILGLLALYEATGDDAIVERARVAGDRLLSARVDVDGSHVWRSSIADGPIQGFTHGVSGVAYALGCLADATGDLRYLNGALDGLAFEDELYDPRRCNWRDLRGDDEGFAVSWCNGRAGIGITRLGLASVCDDDGVTRDVERALSGTDATTLEALDHVCCGNFGRVEWLLEASKQRTDERLRHETRQLATACVERARTERDGAFFGPFSNERIFDPSFFTGASGIGYVLLRLDDPTLPCVLRFE